MPNNTNKSFASKNTNKELFSICKAHIHIKIHAAQHIKYIKVDLKY